MGSEAKIPPTQDTLGFPVWVHGMYAVDPAGSTESATIALICCCNGPIADPTRPYETMTCCGNYEVIGRYEVTDTASADGDGGKEP